MGKVTSRGGWMAALVVVAAAVVVVVAAVAAAVAVVAAAVVAGVQWSWPGGVVAAGGEQQGEQGAEGDQPLHGAPHKRPRDGGGPPGAADGPGRAPGRP